MTPEDIATAREVIAAGSNGPSTRFIVGSVDSAIGWSAALDEVERLTKLSDAGARAVDVVDDQANQLVRLVRAFLTAIPDAALQTDKIMREDIPVLFTDEDGSALYLDEARRRLLAKVRA